MKAELQITGIELYKRDIVVRRKKKHNRNHKRKPIWFYDPEGNLICNQGVRQPITEFTKSSRKNLAFTANNTDVHFDRMVTLTYPNKFPNDGRIIKKHLDAMLQWLRRRNIAGYLWFLEFQKRGAPHYHILTSGGDYIDRYDLSWRWFQIVASNDEKHLESGTRIERGKSERGLHRYAVKYAAKLHQKTVPANFVRVGRLWGCSGNVHPTKAYFVPVDCEGSLSALLKDWRYSGDEANGYNTLFDASEPVINLLIEAGYFG